MRLKPRALSLSEAKNGKMLIFATLIDFYRYLIFLDMPYLDINVYYYY